MTNNKKLKALVSVKDQGIGIPKEQIQKIFDPFYSCRRYPSNQGGIGVGLTISKAICDCLGGKIEISSEMGVGTTFTFSIEIFDDPDHEKVLSQH